MDRDEIDQKYRSLGYANLEDAARSHASQQLPATSAEGIEMLTRQIVSMVEDTGESVSYCFHKIHA